jgi:hypothetical protein
MRLVVPGRFTAINLPGLDLTLVALSWFIASQLNFNIAISPQYF